MSDVENVQQAIINAIKKMGMKSFESKLYHEFEKQIEGKGLTKMEALKLLADLIEIQHIKAYERMRHHAEVMLYEERRK